MVMCVCMCVYAGQSGLGKSTLINSLFMTELYEDSTYDGPSHRIPRTTEVMCVYVCVCACVSVRRC